MSITINLDLSKVTDKTVLKTEEGKSQSFWDAQSTKSYLSKINNDFNSITIDLNPVKSQESKLVNA